MEKRMIFAAVAALCLLGAAPSVDAACIGVSVSINVRDKVKKELRTVVFDTKLHCEKCVEKVKENISYVKGVKDLQVSLENQTIKVTFDPKKTSENTIMEEIRRLGYPATISN